MPAVASLVRGVDACQVVDSGSYRCRERIVALSAIEEYAVEHLLLRRADDQSSAEPGRHHALAVNRRGSTAASDTRREVVAGRIDALVESKSCGLAPSDRFLSLQLLALPRVTTPRGTDSLHNRVADGGSDSVVSSSAARRRSSARSLRGG